MGEIPADFQVPEFSARTREKAWERFGAEEFDILVIGGGITGAGVAHDAASRGLKVALVERGDFACGTSSRSSKLIHGGLRYLENMEFGLVFEALAERAFLLKTSPHLIRPLAFYLPIYKGDKRGKNILSLGLWLYDFLALFRTPFFHRRMSAKTFLKEIPFLHSDGLKGGFRYADASMWDDVMTVEVARRAHTDGAAVANYSEVLAPLWVEGRLRGARVRDVAPGAAPREVEIKAKQVIVCAGPWTDRLGHLLAQGGPAPWKPWLKPSKGVHLVFDLKRIPVPGAMVMSHPTDGRIAFVIPRPDMGAGVTIVGTTDGPAPEDPAQVSVDQSDIDYLMGLLRSYFPSLDLKASDILSSYAGVRPLVDPAIEGGQGGAALRKVSREHHIDAGPGGSVFVAGGKYTTYRQMAAEIVEFALKRWKKAAAAGSAPAVPQVGRSQTKNPINPVAVSSVVLRARALAASEGLQVPEELWSRYGAGALEIMQGDGGESRAGFPRLGAQERFSREHEMVLAREDFERRRSALWTVGQ